MLAKEVLRNSMDLNRRIKEQSVIYQDWKAMAMEIDEDEIHEIVEAAWDDLIASIRLKRKLEELIMANHNADQREILRLRYLYAATWDAIADEKKIVVVQIAPAVRAAWGEAMGMKREDATVGKILDAWKRMGADYVFDTSFSADLTIMEEATEFLERFQNGSLNNWPMFTSCCPGWLRFVKTQFPEMVPQLSTAKSPQQMFGAVMKTYFAQSIGVDPENIVTVSVMPCVAKKAEANMDFYYKEYAGKDVDIVLTTREFTRMLRETHLRPEVLTDRKPDSLMQEWTGAGVIFGATGGVMEAALRTVYELVTGRELPRGALPADAGVIVDNVTTVSAIGRFLRTGMPLTTRRLTVTGDVFERPRNLEVVIGTLIGAVVDYCRPVKEPRKIITGGPMMGVSQMDVNYPITRQNNGLLVFSGDAANQLKPGPCIRCGRCVRACPAGLSPVEIHDAYHRFDVDEIFRLDADLCMGCGSCSYICPAKRPLTQAATLARDLLKDRGMKHG